MPHRPLSYCTWPGGCSNKVVSGRCPEHKRKYERDRGSASKRGYGREWQRIRDDYLDRHPFCEAEEGCTELATQVDHIDGGGPRGDNSDANLQALCARHHSKKTVAVDGGFGRAILSESLRGPGR